MKLVYTIIENIQMIFVHVYSKICGLFAAAHGKLWLLVFDRLATPVLYDSNDIPWAIWG